jgi:hypothetical protein
MLWNPGGQYQPVASPWDDYSVYSFPDASRIEPVDQQPVMDAMNGIIAVNWQATEPHWSVASSPFDKRYSLILVRDGAGLAAFSVYRMLRVAGRPAIYRSGTEVLPAHQGRGLYRFFTTEVLKQAGTTGGGGNVLYGWRTRNPIVWAANAKICDKVTPSLLREDHDPALEAACMEMCAAIYPGKPLEFPDMIMRGAYGHIKHHRQAYRGLAEQVDAAMSRIIPNSDDALFSVGYART